MEPNQDAALIERIRGGESAAFIDFYDRYSPLLFSVAARVLGERKEAEDVLQEVMLVIWNKSGDFDPQLGTLSSWAVTVTRNKALDRLRARYKLVVLSNGDPDMLETARGYHGIAFDRIISVAVAGAFKPHHATYEKAAEQAGVRRDEVLFVANHAFDCIGAKAAGMRTAFVDRRRRPFGATPHQPDLIVASMTELAELLAPEHLSHGIGEVGSVAKRVRTQRAAAAGAPVGIHPGQRPAWA